MAQKACRNCRIIVESDKCPICQSGDLTKTWEGLIMIINPEGSEVCQTISVTIPGIYALKIK